MYEFAKEIYFDETVLGNKSIRDESFIGLLKSPVTMVPASGVSSSHKKNFFSKTRFSTSDPNGLFDRSEILLQEKQAGKNF